MQDTVQGNRTWEIIRKNKITVDAIFGSVKEMGKKKGKNFLLRIICVHAINLIDVGSTEVVQS